MSNTTASRDHALSRLEVVSYGLGDMSASLAWNTVAAFALYFYTDIALLPAAVIGTLFLVSRMVDAVFDLGVGATVDRTRSRWGKARPYLLFAAVPFGLFTVLTFLTPDASETVRFYYAAFTYFVLGLLLSVVNIPYSALLPMMSRNLSDRVDLSVARAVGTSLGVITATAVFLPGVSYFGQGDERRGFLIMASIISVVSTLMLLTTFANCRERYADKSPPGTGILADIGMMFRNRAWLSVSGFALFNFVRFGAILALTPFFAINVLRQPWMISVLLPTLSGTMLVGAFIARPILRRFGMKRTDTVALLVSILLYLVLPFAEDEPWLFIAIYVLAGLVTSITMTSIYAMASESVDYHELKFGIRQEGLLASGIAFAIKVGMAFGSAGIAYALALGGYDPAAVTDKARGVMSWLYYGLPIAIYLLQILCVQFYLVDDIRDEMKATIDARKAEATPA